MIRYLLRDSIILRIIFKEPADNLRQGSSSESYDHQKRYSYEWNSERHSIAVESRINCLQDVRKIFCSGGSGHDKEGKVIFWHGDRNEPLSITVSRMNT